MKNGERNLRSPFCYAGVGILGVAPLQSLGEPLGLVKHLKYFVKAQSESLQCGRSQYFPFAAGIDILESTLAKAQNRYGFFGKIYHPVFGYTVPGIQAALEGLVSCCCGRRQNFDDEVWCALNIRRSDDIGAFIGDEDQIGLHHVHV